MRAVAGAIVLSALPVIAQVPPVDSARPQRGGEITVSGCVQSEADYQRTGGIGAAKPDTELEGQFVLLDAKGVAFNLSGTRERDLRSRVGRRVEIRGVVEGQSADTSIEAVAGATPLGSPAHEPGDAATAARIEGPVASAPALPRINIRSFSALEGPCNLPQPKVDRASAPAATPNVPARAARTAPTRELSTLQGCVARDPENSQRLILTKATTARAAVAGGTAVPGSLPSGSGSGTTPSNQRQRSGDAEALSFILNGQPAALASRVGSRVEVTGVVAEELAAQQAAGQTVAEGARLPAQAPSVSHPSALLRRIEVTSVRVIGGACP
jgi:hypothetical protein